MPRILVTGATGFVGSHVLRTLQTAGLDVIAACRDEGRLDKDFTGERRIGDLLDQSYVGDLVSGVDILCHCAAWTSLFGHERQSRALYLEPTLGLINAGKEAGIARFINVSTTSAAAPGHSGDAIHPGIMRSYWPHLNNVIRIENHLREHADLSFQAINLRLGLFAGSHYALGLLPILLPRLKTHLVPWVNAGRTSMPIIDGRDIGRAFLGAVQAGDLAEFESFNIVGPQIPTARQVLEYLHEAYGYPLPHFSVPFPVAYTFARVMELIDPLVPWEPLVTRSIIHLLEEVDVDNHQASDRLGYEPDINWHDAVDAQLAEMRQRHSRPMSMARPYTPKNFS